MATKSKAKVNTRFVLILISVVGATLVLLGGLWMLRQRADATRNLVRYRTLMEKGDYDAALLQISRAVHKEPTKAEYLRLMEDTLAHIRPTTQDRASELYREKLQVLQHDVTYRSSDAKVHMRLVQEMYDCARFLDLSTIWTELGNAADAMETHLREDDPERLTARLYRGMARMQVRTQLAPEGVTAAIDDIKAFKDANPTDDLGWAKYILSEVQLYQDYKSRGESNRANEQLVKIDTAIADALKAVPDGPEVAIMNALRLQFGEETRSSSPKAAAAVEHLAHCLSFSTDPQQLSYGALIMHQTSAGASTPQALALLRPFLEAHPDRIDVQLRLAKLCLYSGDTDTAEKEAKAVLEHEPLPVSYLSGFQLLIQEDAGSILVDVAFQRWEKAPDDAVRAALVQPIADARERLASHIAQAEGNQSLIRADGKLAYARGQYETAAAKFEDIVKLTHRNDSESLIYAGISLDRINQTGLAIDRLTAAVILQPRNIELMLQLARMQFNLRRWDELKVTLDNIHRLDPDNADAARIAKLYKETAPDQTTKRDEPWADAVHQADAADAAGDPDAARTILKTALLKYPHAQRVMERLFQIEVKAGRLDDAAAIIDQALKDNPDSAALQRTRLTLKIKDPVERLEAIIDLDQQPPVERAVAKAVNLYSLSRAMRMLGEQQAKSAKPADADQSREISARAKSRADTFRAEAAQGLSPGSEHPRVLDYLYSQALVDHDWPTADNLMPQLIKLNADQADGHLIRGRYELAKGQDAAAVKSLTLAVAKKDFSSDGWRLLGLAYSRVGNVTEAQRSYETAFQRNPNDVQMIKLYVELLLRVGDQPRALTVLRKARQMVGNDQDVREAWLGMEADVGDLVVAIKERRERYRQAPNDRVNAAALARMLVQAQPTYAHVLDKEGKPRFTPELWRTQADTEQRRMLTDVKSQWNQESERIITQLGSKGEDDLELTVLRAMLLFAKGQPDAGQTLLREWIKRQNPAQLTTEPYFSLADYQRRMSQDPATIVATLEEARKYQSNEAREIDRALADQYMRMSRNEDALAAFERIIQTAPDDRMVRIHAVECLMRLQRIDEAWARLKQMTDQGGEDYASLTMKGMLLDAQAKDLLAAGQTEQAEHKLADEAKALDAALQLDPNNPVPILQKARSLIAAYRRTKEQRLFDEASMALSQVEKLRADFGPLFLLKADLWLARDDAKRAIQEMKRYMKIEPGNADARESLVKMLMADNNVAEAIEVVAEGTTYNPGVALWWEILGSMRFNRAEWAPAADALSRAYELHPTRDSLGRLVASLLALTPPDHQKAIRLLTARPETLEDPLLHALYAVALYLADRRDEAKDHIRQSYKGYRKAIAEGSNPADIDTWFVSARQLFPSNDVKSLEELFMEACANKPDLYELQSLAKVWAMNESGLSHAVELQRKAIAMCLPENTVLLSDLYANLAPFCIRAKDYVCGVEALEMVVKYQPDNISALNDLAYLLASELKQAAKALPHAQRIVELLPTNPTTLDTLAFVLMALDRYDEAEPYLDKAIKYGGLPEVYLHYAQVLRHQKREADAEKALRTALKMKPNESTLQEINQQLDDIKSKAGKK